MGRRSEHMLNHPRQKRQASADDSRLEKKPVAIEALRAESVVVSNTEEEETSQQREEENVVRHYLRL